MTPFGDCPGLAITLDRTAPGLAAVLNGIVAAPGEYGWVIVATFDNPRRSATAEVDLTVR